MSEKNVALFYNEVEKDEDLKSKLKGVSEKTLTKEVFESKVLPEAKAKGYDFSYEDVKEYYKQQNKAQLSIDNLEDVAGGSGSCGPKELSGSEDTRSRECRFYAPWNSTPKADSTCEDCKHFKWSAGFAYCTAENR